MKLIVGLGNPGEKYENTRHNLGFMVVEKFLKDFEPVLQTVWHDEPKFKSDVAEITWQTRSSLRSSLRVASGQAGQAPIEKIILAKPKTYMNGSGLSVQLLTTYYSPRGEAGKLLTTNIWIIHDDVDLPLGAMKIRFGGASAGHKGVESIINALKTDKFWRFRLGIGEQYQKSNTKDQKFRNVDDYVLSGFKGNERGKVKNLIKRGSKAIQTALEEGLEMAMNRFNTK